MAHWYEVSHARKIVHCQIISNQYLSIKIKGLKACDTLP